jgi:anti-anti-sigma regulatory factor
LANPGSAVFVDDADLAVPATHAERLLGAFLEIARARGLQLVLAAREPAFATAAERLGLEVVSL